MPNWTTCKVGKKVDGETILACPKCGKPCIRGSKFARRKGGFIQNYDHETKITHVAGMAFNHVMQHCAVVIEAEPAEAR